MTTPIDEVTGEHLDKLFLLHEYGKVVTTPSGASMALGIKPNTMYSMCGGRIVHVTLSPIAKDVVFPTNQNPCRAVGSVFRTMLVGILHLQLLCPQDTPSEDVDALKAMVERWIMHLQRFVSAEPGHAEVTWDSCEVSETHEGAKRTIPCYVVHYIDYDKNALFQGDSFRGCYLCGTVIPPNSPSNPTNTKCPECNAYIGSCGGYADNSPGSLDRRHYATRYIKRVPVELAAGLSGDVLYCFNDRSGVRSTKTDVDGMAEHVVKELCKILLGTHHSNKDYAIISSCMNAADSRSGYFTDLVIASLWRMRRRLTKYGLSTCTAPAMAINPREHYHATDSVVVMVNDWKKVAKAANKVEVIRYE